MHKTTQAVHPPPVRQENSRYQKTTLDNGLRIVTETIPHVRSVSLGIWAHVGSRDEEKSENGISHFLEHMVFKGTKNRNVREIAQSLESLGGYLNAFTTKEQTCFYSRVLDEHLPEAMDVLADLILNSTLKREELEREKLVVIEELKNAEDDPEDVIHDYFEKALFPNHSLGYPIIGTEENVRRFQREHLRAHLAAHYVPSQMVLAAAGSIEHDALVRFARKYFRALRLNGTPLKKHPVPSRLDKASYEEISRPINQAHICLGAVGYGIRHRDRYPLLVLNALLGEGMSSRLYQNIREKHALAYSVYSYVTMLSDTGVFATYLGTDKKNIKNALELVHKELERLKHRPVPKTELDRTKSQIKGTMMLGLENMSGRMIRLGSSELYLESYVTLDTILGKVDAVTAEDIQRVAKDLFDASRFSTIVIRPS
jgi:predicted Zn-dependent peptidase